MARLRRLKNVKVSEVSIVDRPVFGESKILLMKQAAVVQGIRFVGGQPAHPWFSIEGLPDPEGLVVIATGVVLQAGDSKPDGGEWSVEELELLFQWWAMHVSAPGRGNTWLRICDADGSINMDSSIISWGLTGDKGGLDLYAGGDEPIGPNAWFAQIEVVGETARKLLADGRVLNGLAPLDPVVLLDKGLDDADLDAMGPDELADAIGRQGDELYTTPAELVQDIAIELAEKDVSPGELVDEIVQAVADEQDQADPPDDTTRFDHLPPEDRARAWAAVSGCGERDVDVASLASEVAGAVLDDLDGDEIDPVAFGEELGRAVVDEVTQEPERETDPAELGAEIAQAVVKAVEEM